MALFCAYLIREIIHGLVLQVRDQFVPNFKDNETLMMKSFLNPKKLKSSLKRKIILIYVKYFSRFYVIM